ncbi:MAG: hypothetical protein ACRD3Q_09730 [Terriglobales bacterium]
MAESHDDVQREMAHRQEPISLVEGIDLARRVGGLAAGYQMTIDEAIPWTPDSAPARSVCFIYALPCMSKRAQIANTVVHEWRHHIQSQIAREGPGGYENIAFLHARHKPLVEGDATDFTYDVLNEAVRQGALDPADVRDDLREEAQFRGLWREMKPHRAEEWNTQNNYATGTTQLRAITLGLKGVARRAVLEHIMSDPHGLGRRDGEKLTDWGARLRVALEKRGHATSAADRPSSNHSRRIWSPTSRVLPAATTKRGLQRP